MLLFAPISLSLFPYSLLPSPLFHVHFFHKLPLTLPFVHHHQHLYCYFFPAAKPAPPSNPDFLSHLDHTVKILESVNRLKQAFAPPPQPRYNSSPHQAAQTSGANNPSGPRRTPGVYRGPPHLQRNPKAKSEPEVKDPKAPGDGTW